MNKMKLIGSMLCASLILAASSAMADEATAPAADNPVRAEIQKDKEQVKADRAQLKADRQKLHAARKEAHEARKAKRKAKRN